MSTRSSDSVKRAKTRSSDSVRTRADKPDSERSAPRAQRPADRRAAARHPIEIAIEMSVGREMLIYATTNLSKTGAFFKRAIPYAVGTSVELAIHLPGERAPIRCAGVVVNVPNKKDLGMGVKFVDICEADQARIEQLAGWRAPELGD